MPVRRHSKEDLEGGIFSWRPDGTKVRVWSEAGGGVYSCSASPDDGPPTCVATDAAWRRSRGDGERRAPLALLLSLIRRSPEPEESLERLVARWLDARMKVWRRALPEDQSGSRRWTDNRGIPRSRILISTPCRAA